MAGLDGWVGDFAIYILLYTSIYIFLYIFASMHTTQSRLEVHTNVMREFPFFLFLCSVINN